MVADADATVGSAESHKRACPLDGRRCFDRDSGGVGHNCILQVVRTFAVVRVNVLSSPDVLGSHSDELTILDDLLPFGNIHEGNLVEQWDVVGHRDGLHGSVRRWVTSFVTSFQLVGSDSDVVPLIDDNGVLALAYNV